VRTTALFIIACSMFLVTLAACGPYRAEYTPNPIQEQERVVLLDKKVEGRIELVRELTPARLTGGELEVGVILVNTKSRGIFGGKKDLPCDYKFQFLDSEGGVIEETPWEYRLFQRGMEITLKKNSISPKAEKYRVTVRLQE